MREPSIGLRVQLHGFLPREGASLPDRVPVGTTVREILADYVALPENGWRYQMTLVNGRQARLDTVLQDGDCLHILKMSWGG